MLAALCAVLSLRTGQPRCSLTGLLHNRYGPRLRQYVGSLASDAIIAVDTDARGFDDLVRRAGMTTLRAGKGGLVDGDELRRVVDEVERDRGIAYARDCVYNDTSYVDLAPPSAPGDPADAARALGRSELRWIESAGAGVRIVDDALPASAARVFAEPGPAGEPQLVAYLAASDGLRTPEQAHDACMTVLPAGRQPPDQMRYTAMTPGRYVICAAPPADLADLAAWRRQPVLASGDGRSRPARVAVGQP